MYIHTYLMDMSWISVRWWWLRSNTDLYGRTFLEVAYGEIIFHSTEVVWVMKAREEWLGCQHDASPMFDIPGSTLVWALYIIFFFWISRYKNLYVFCFQIYTYYKRTLVVSDLVLAGWSSENVFDRSKALKKI